MAVNEQQAKRPPQSTSGWGRLDVHIALSSHATMDLTHIIRQALEEDLGSGDITTAAYEADDAQGIGTLRAKEACVVCGAEVLREVFRQIDSSLMVAILKGDGEKVSAGTAIATITGGICSILKGERVALNFVQRLSGIATVTARFAQILKHAHIYDTRKTTPLLREIEKYAVRIGGGHNHRMGLYDAILIKDNHIALAGSIMRALEMARIQHPSLPREIEVSNDGELQEALDAGAEILLLDNMTPEQVQNCLIIIHTASYKPEVEISGNISLENVSVYDLPGIHRISAGCLTHSVKAIDMNLKIVTLPAWTSAQLN